nr:meiosis-specific nuclear structural protein 1-like [Leptinotarsa decemlineata]
MALNQDKRLALSEELEKKKYTDTLENIRAHIESKHQYRNLNRYLNIQRQEHEEDMLFQKARADAAFKERQMVQDNDLARELDMIKRDEIKKLKLRQQLRENSHELRDLERKLKAAYINKELAAQIAQKEAERENEKIQENRTQEILKMAWVEESEYKKKLAQEDMIKKQQYKQELQDQMILREKSKRHLYEEFLREKKLIDDVIQRIHDEDEREASEKMCKMKRTREEMDAFKEAQEVWRKRKRIEIEEENRRIEEYLLSKAEGIKARQEEQAKQEALKAHLSDVIAKQLYEESMKQKERDDIIQDLLEEEQKEALEKRHREEIEKQIRKRIEIRESLDQQMLDKQRILRQEADDDRKFKEQMLEKLAEDEKLEQLSAQRKRMRMLQLRRDVEQMMIERRQKHAEELQLLINLEEQAHMEMEERKRIVEEERHRMLREHVKNLIGYLPKGILKPDDLPHLDSDIVDKVSPGVFAMNI